MNLKQLELLQKQYPALPNEKSIWEWTLPHTV